MEVSVPVVHFSQGLGVVHGPGPGCKPPCTFFSSRVVVVVVVLDTEYIYFYFILDANREIR